MSIYSPVAITEDIENHFRPTRLYIKELNGLKYFGKTTAQDISKYPGSGTRWRNHVKKYGLANIKTIWVSDWFLCPRHLQDFALMFSEANQIVESSSWANLAAENGLSGGHYNLAAKSALERSSIRQKVSTTLMSKTPEQKAKRSTEQTKFMIGHWSNTTPEARTAHATNTSVGVKNMWCSMSERDKKLRKEKEMRTKNAKSLADKEQTSARMRLAKQRILNRANVLALKAIAEARRIKLGRNWRSRPDDWIDQKIQELSV